MAGVTATLFAMAWLPAAASAQPPNISIISAQPDSNGDPYDLTVAADDGNGLLITSMTAHVFDSGNNDVANPVMQFSSGPASDQIWTPQTPIAQSALPPGTYTVTVDATDSGGESDAGLQAPGSFSFSYTSTLTVSANPAVASQGAQNVTFTGAVTGVAPGGNPVGLGSGIGVDLSIGGVSQGQVTTTTDGSGDFSYTVNNVSQSADYRFSIAATSTYSGASADVTVNTGQATTSIAVAPSPPTVTQGSQKVTFSGTVSVTPVGSSTPVGIGSGVPVFLSIGGGTPNMVTSTDDANGDFSYTLPGITQTSDYNFSVGGTSLYTSASNDVTVDAVAATTGISVTPSPAMVSAGSQNVTFSGQVSIVPPGGSTAGIGAGVPVLLSIGGVSQGVVTMTTDASGDFSYTVSGITQSTDYDFSVNSTSLYTAVSEDIVVPVQPAQTAVSVTASPQNVTFGSQNVTFTGTVTARPPGSSSSVGVGGGVPVLLSIGGATAKQVTTTSDASGDFSYTVQNVSTATDYNFSVGAASLFTAASDDVNVPVDPGTTNLQVTANPPDVNLGSSTVTFTGSVTVKPLGSPTALGIGSGVPVLLSIGGAAATQVTTTDDANGDFSYTIKGIKQPNDYDFSVAAGTLYGPATDDVPIGLNQLNTNLSVVPSQMTVTEGSQNVTFKGTVTGTAPDSTTVQNLPAGVPVDLAIGKGKPEPVATTNSNSQFSFTVKGVSRVTTYDFSVGSTITYTAGTDDVSIGLSPARTRITGVSVSPLRLKYGQKATLKGTVEYLSGKIWKDLPGPLVHLAEGKTAIGSVRANSKGFFKASLPTTHGFGWSGKVAAGSLIQQASVTGNLSIAVPLSVESFTARLGVDTELSVSGCVQVTVPVNYAPLSRVAIQYAGGSRGPWKTLGDLHLRDINGPKSRCGAANQSFFGGSIRVKLANAYYRADFPANVSFESAASKPVHLFKNRTLINGFGLRPRSVAKNQKVTITGRLWQKGKSLKPFGKQKVEFVYNDKGTSFWGKLGSTVTTARGYFKQVAVGGSGTFVAIVYAEYAGSKTDFAVRSSGADLSVNPRKSNVAASVGAGQYPVVLGPQALGLVDAVQAVVNALRPLLR